MRKTFLQTLRDEPLRIEVGPAALAALAVENLDLSTPERSRSVRRCTIERRVPRHLDTASPRPTTSPSRTANLLTMHEVVLVRQGVPAPEYCAA
jgi:hypothetical protein